MSDANCAEILPLLQAIEPGFEIGFDYDSEKYLIAHNGSPFQTVPYKEMDRATIAKIRHTVWLNKTGQLLDYCEKSEAKVAASEERAQELYAECLAKDLRKPLVKDYYGG
jgi:hypothetical protein